MKKIVKQPVTLLLLLLALMAAIHACKKERIATPEAPLQVDSYYPNSGKDGTLVTITGENFKPEISAQQVTFGGVEAEVISATKTQLVVRSPKGAASGPIVLNNGTPIEIGPYTYQSLSLQEINPKSGIIGTQVRLTGEGFGSTDSLPEVFFNDIKAAVSTASDTLLIVKVPTGASTGQIRITVDGQETMGPQFDISAFNKMKPMSGAAGTRVVISGSGFDPQTGNSVVKFNDKEAQVIEAKPDTLIVLAPEEVISGTVTVTIGELTMRGPQFTVVPPPTIELVSPLSGPAGQEMTIKGTNFSIETDENLVTVNGNAIPVKDATPTELKLVLPENLGSGKIKLDVNGQTIEGPTFIDQNLGVTMVIPRLGRPGMEIRIQGVGFSAEASQNQVLFNGVSAKIINATPQELTVIAPEGFTDGSLQVRIGSIEAKAPEVFHRGGVITIAGGPASNEFSNDVPGISVDSKGNIFIADNGSKCIKKITPDGQVTLFAGSPVGTPGHLDGHGSEALFTDMTDMIIDNQDNLYVNSRGPGGVGVAAVIRKISPSAQVSTVYRTALYSLMKLSFDEKESLYFNDPSSYTLYKFDRNGTYDVVPGTAGWSYYSPVIKNGIVYTSDINSSRILKIDTNTGRVDESWVGSFTDGFQDGTGTDAQFYYPANMRMDKQGQLIVSDQYNYAIRKIDPVSRQVTTLVKGGDLYTGGGFADGGLTEAKFEYDVMLSTDKEGYIYFLDKINKAVRVLIPY